MLDLTGVKALTLTNPWAYAITDCGKRVENRGWMPHQGVDRIFIHSGQRTDLAAAAYLTELGFDPTLATASVVVAVADIASVCGSSRTVPGNCGCGPWAIDYQYHWNLVGVRVLTTPVPAKGRQTLWLPSPSIVDQIREALP